MINKDASSLRKEIDYISETVERTIEMLPAREQDLAFEFIKRLVLARDPDYTKLTPDERLRLEAAEDGEYINEKDIDWDE